MNVSFLHRFIFCLAMACLMGGCQSINGSQNTGQSTSHTRSYEKQKGAHVFGHLDTINIKPFVSNNFNWITLVPFAGQADYDSEKLRYTRGDSLRQLRRDSMWHHKINVAHNSGFKVFLKPHIWMHEPSDGKWRSDIFPVHDEAWAEWKENYGDFILKYAKIAEQNDVELFCVGTELTRLSIEKPKFWQSLIAEVRSVYSGQLTYAANWYKEYETITFWDDLDYIGVQAYFPLVKKKSPTVGEISEGWSKYLTELETISNKYAKPILFTEMGYKSTEKSAMKPWEWVEYPVSPEMTICNETQANCYQAFFDVVWTKGWMAGVHLWQLRADTKSLDEQQVFDFTPQHKPAEAVIAKGFQ